MRFFVFLFAALIFLSNSLSADAQEALPKDPGLLREIVVGEREKLEKLKPLQEELQELLDRVQELRRNPKANAPFSLPKDLEAKIENYIASLKTTSTVDVESLRGNVFAIQALFREEEGRNSDIASTLGIQQRATISFRRIQSFSFPNNSSAENIGVFNTREGRRLQDALSEAISNLGSPDELRDCRPLESYIPTIESIIDNKGQEEVANLPVPLTVAAEFRSCIDSMKKASGDLFNNLRAKFFDQAEALISQEKSRIDTLLTSHRQTIDRAQTTLDKSDSISSNLINYALPVFGLLILALLLIPRAYSENVQSAIFGRGLLLEVLTVFLLIAAILILGLAERIEPNSLGTLIGGISGYILGRASGESRYRRDGSFDDISQQPHLPK